jgi:hypothetical protein
VAAFKGLCPCIIQEAPQLETANAVGFSFPGEDLCLKPQLFKIAMLHAWNLVQVTLVRLSSLRSQQRDTELQPHVALVHIQTSLSLSLFFVFVLFKNAEVGSKQQPALLELRLRGLWSASWRV